MLCTRCHHFEAAPDGVLCTQCAAPTGFQALPAGAAPTAWLRSPVGLGRAAAVMLGLVAAADLFSLGAGALMYDASGDLAAGDFGDAVVRRADQADVLYTVASAAQSVTLIACAIVYLNWFQRVRVNAEAFDSSGHSKKRGWTIWAWFVPIVNLWFPRRIALDIWDASSPWGKPRGHGLVNTWWTLWIVALFAGRVGYSAYQRADTAQEIHDATVQAMFADALDLWAALFAVLVVLRLTRMQDEKAHQGPVPVAA
ncbi:DUF4328 domain-containing protein [Streptomyces fulvoviolaceus]|uniref:DUF4328 domain-containing protein n=1 Tax=Streptomyces fulvoviolaceus TaxID=285535 RepID=UPI0004C6B114|nr:DUF4328 domain-containing protein [Streptomyces fulvoviolaceus]